MKIINTKTKNGTLLNFGNINIFVGPNGVGKTTLLKEILKLTYGNKGSLNWLEEIEVSPLDKLDIKILYDNNFIESRNNDSGVLHIIRDQEGRWNKDAARVSLNKEEYEAIKLIKEGAGGLSEKQMNILGTNYELRKNLITFESTRDRLSSLGEFETADFKQITVDKFNFIERFQDKLDQIFFNIFNYHFYVLPHRGRITEMVFCENNLDPGMNKHNKNEIEQWKESNKAKSINDAGDGLNAAATIFFSIFNPISKIILIDEPETFIYPKQKKKIAEEIKLLARENDKQIFIVTHDATFLAGLIDNIRENDDIRLFFLKNQERVISIELSKTIKPTTKQEKYLQALFHEGAIFLEGVNDRFFYENTMEEIYKEELPKMDISFIETGGASRGLNQIIKFIKNTEINSAFVLDLNYVADKEKKKDIIELNNGKTIPELEKLHEVINQEAKKKLIHSYKFFLSDNSTKITDPEWFNKNEEHFGAVFNELEKTGVFIVPVGSVESWVGKDKNSYDDYGAVDEIIKNPKLNDYKNFCDKVIRYFKG